MLPRIPLPALSLALLLAPAPSIDRALELHTAGRLPEALREYHAVVAAGGDPAAVATALHNACALQMNLGDYRAALPDCREALRRLRDQKDPAAIGQALNNLGMALQAAGETAEAGQRFREALELNRRTGNAESETVNLANLGTLAQETGRYAAALDLHAQAAALAGSHRGEPWAAEQIRIARINQGVALEKVGAYREALEIYKGLLADGGEPDPDRRASLQVNSGVIYRNLGDPVTAVESFREAIGLYEKAGDTAGLSNAHLNLGLALHLNLERPAEAEAAYREALRLAVASGDRAEEIQDLFYLGRLLLGQGRGDEAGEVFRRCLAAAEASGSAEGKWSAREGLGRLARSRGDLAGALGHFEAALGEIEHVRAGLSRGRRRSGYFGDKRAVYAAAVETLAELERRQPGRGWGDRGLWIVQRAKARDLLDALGGGGGGCGPELPLTAAFLRSKADGGVTLEYFLGEANLYLWVIRPAGIGFHDLGPRRPVLDGAAAVHRALSHGEAPPAATVAALSRVLLGPLGEESGDLLRISPDGALRHLPFELLEPRPGEPLIERWAVTYLPSASTPVRSRISPLDMRSLLGVANPWIPAPGSGPPSPRDLLVERFRLAPLASAEREVGEAQRLLGGWAAYLTRGQATEIAFRNAAARGAMVIHLAAHAVVDERPGRGAAILLAPYRDDGLLTPEKIATLNARTNLTVLAACRTALGPEEDGQALTSLTGAFLAAGSRGVVATLWDVGDAPTAAFMEQFYWQLSRGFAPAEALARAKRRLRADPRWSRPDLWAGYVLVGEPSRVADRPRYLPEGFDIAILFLLGQLWWRWRRRATG